MAKDSIIIIGIIVIIVAFSIFSLTSNDEPAPIIEPEVEEPEVQEIPVREDVVIDDIIEEPVIEEPIVEDSFIEEESESIDDIIELPTPPIVEEGNAVDIVLDDRTVTGYGTYYSDDWIINRLTISASDINPELLDQVTIAFENRYTSSSLIYDATLDCAKPQQVVTKRKTAYGYDEQNQNICVSPSQDLREQGRINVTLYDSGNQFWSKELVVPPVLLSATYQFE